MELTWFWHRLQIGASKGFGTDYKSAPAKLGEAKSAPAV